MTISSNTASVPLLSTKLWTSTCMVKPITREQSILAIVAYAELGRIKHQSTNKGKSCNRFRFLLNCPQLLYRKKTIIQNIHHKMFQRENMPFKSLWQSVSVNMGTIYKDYKKPIMWSLLSAVTLILRHGCKNITHTIQIRVRYDTCFEQLPAINVYFRYTWVLTT